MNCKPVILSKPAVSLQENCKDIPKIYFFRRGIMHDGLIILLLVQFFPLLYFFRFPVFFFLVFLFFCVFMYY